MSSIIFATLKALKFPLKLLIGLRKKKSPRTKLEQKCHQHVRNFSPTHYSWQQRQGKKMTKKQREYYKKKQKDKK
ncbi:MAG: hypothetical protein MRERV_1c171 [Mycoplasmataceae bacterium RV_VA103A]|nr:MAG: hypothetical protein MRERV_1c171 [Mycoplasmataceae bacterium RV_VA103A]